MEEIGLMMGGAHDMEVAHVADDVHTSAMIAAGPKRPQPSRIWTAATPVLAVVATMIAGGIMFAALGKDPFEAIRMIFWDPLFNEQFAAFSRPAASGQGRAADPDRHRPVAGLPRGHLEHRGRGAVHHRRDLRRGGWRSPSIRSSSPADLPGRWCWRARSAAGPGR